MTNKIIISIITVFAMLIITGLAFNHIDPWIGVVLGAIFTIIILKAGPKYFNSNDSKQ